jgi:hypothetical protein
MSEARMAARFTIKKKFVVNGREYASLAELPQAVRDAVESATVSAGPPAGSGRITIDGREFESVDAIPADLRPLYDDAMKEIEAAGALPAGPAASARSVPDSVLALSSGAGEAGSLLPRWLILAIALTAAAGVYYLFLR